MPRKEPWKDLLTVKLQLVGLILDCLPGPARRRAKDIERSLITCIHEMTAAYLEKAEDVQPEAGLRTVAVE